MTIGQSRKEAIRSSGMTSMSGFPSRALPASPHSLILIWEDGILPHSPSYKETPSVFPADHPPSTWGEREKGPVSPRRLFVLRGRIPLFFKSTMDSPAIFLAAARCSGHKWYFFSASGLASLYGCSNRPSLFFKESIRRTASSSICSVMVPS